MDKKIEDKKQKNSKLILGLAIGIPVFLIISCLFAGLMIRRQIYGPRNWDKTESIKLLKKIPEDSISYGIGCIDQKCQSSGIFSKSPELAGTVYVSKADFAQKFEEEIFEPDQSKKDKVLDELNKNNNLEDFLTQIKEKYSADYSSDISDIKDYFVVNGKCAVVNPETKEQYKVLIHRDRGMTCGQLCGSGSEWIETEDGKVLMVIMNWIS